MPLAIINKQTKKVVNMVVPPEGSDVFFLGAEFEGVMTDVGAIGDIYNSETGEFSKSSTIIPDETNVNRTDAILPDALISG